jgi:hypothetical protein
MLPAPGTLALALKRWLLADNLEPYELWRVLSGGTRSSLKDYGKSSVL